MKDEKTAPENRKETGVKIKRAAAKPAEKLEDKDPENRTATGRKKPAAKKASTRTKPAALKVKAAGSAATQFKPGQSGNPGGRPKMPEEIRDMFREISPRACEVLCDIINDHKAKNADRIRAAEVILDRAWGKPRQQVDLDTAGVPTVIFMNGDNVAD